MYVGVIHRISDPEKFFAIAQETVANLPEGVTVQQIMPATGGATCLCVWQAPSVDAVREVVDGAAGSVAVNECFEIAADQALGLR